MIRRCFERLAPAALLVLSAAACASVEPVRTAATPARVAPPERAATPYAVRSNAPIPNPPERAASTKAPSSAVKRALGGYKIGKPYQVAGVWYVPAEQPHYDAVGAASWYGDAFHGKPTATGEPFDMHLASAAHPTLPLPSIVEVTNLENDRSIQVRVNDRGPFKHGRIIDVSREAADQLGFIRQGTAKVRVRYVGPAPLDPFLRSPSIPDRPARPTLIAASMPAPDPVPVRRAEASRHASTPAPTPAAPSFAVQAGAFANRGNAERAARALGAIGPAQVRESQRDGAVLYRVLVGAWPARDAAIGALSAVAEAGFPDARVVTAS